MGISFVELTLEQQVDAVENYKNQRYYQAEVDSEDEEERNKIVAEYDLKTDKEWEYEAKCYSFAVEDDGYVMCLM